MPSLVSKEKSLEISKQVKKDYTEAVSEVEQHKAEFNIGYKAKEAAASVYNLGHQTGFWKGIVFGWIFGIIFSSCLWAWWI